MEKVIFSIIIPVRDISDYLISETLPALKCQTFNSFEVIILPDRRSKKTRDLIKTYPWLRIRSTPTVTLPAGKRNQGYRVSKGDILVFVDDDAYPPKDWLAQARRLFLKKKIDAMCGPGILPLQAKFSEKVFDQVLQTTIGSGLYTYRFTEENARYVDDYPTMNFFIKRNLFKKVGGFRERYWPGEDSKLCNEITHAAKEPILYSPRLVIFHHRKKNLFEFLKQHARYGFHRGVFFIQGDKNSQKIIYLIPALLVVYLILLAMLVFFKSSGNIQTYLFIPLYAYFLANLYIFFKSFFITDNLIIPFGTVLTTVLMHIAYGISFSYGLIKEILEKSHDKKS